MNTAEVANAALLLLLLPLLLAMLIILCVRCRPVLRLLLPWAALPALLLIMLPDTRWLLQPILLGSQLLLDEQARWVLLAVNLLLLAGGLSLRAQLCSDTGAGFWYLLALTFTQLTVLAGETLLLFASATVAGYALLGLSLSAIPAEHYARRRRAAVPVVVLLVLADLLLFEFFILLAHEAVGTQFLGQREVLASRTATAFLPLLGALGFGCRLALVGLLPVLLPLRASAQRGLWLAVLAYALAAGISAPMRLYAAVQTGEVPASYWIATISCSLLLLLLAFAVMRWGTLVVDSVSSAGGYFSHHWQTLAGRVNRGRQALLHRSGYLGAAEQWLGRWTVALGLLLIVALLLAAASLG